MQPKQEAPTPFSRGLTAVSLLLALTALLGAGCDLSSSSSDDSPGEEILDLDWDVALGEDTEVRQDDAGAADTAFVADARPDSVAPTGDTESYSGDTAGAAADTSTAHTSTADTSTADSEAPGDTDTADAISAAEADDTEVFEMHDSAPSFDTDVDSAESIDDIATGDVVGTDTETADTAATEPPPRDLTFCLTGAPSRDEPSNQPFNALCDDPAVPGVVPSCQGSSCYSTFESFLIDVPSTIYPHLFAALDDNGDGLVDEADTPTRLSLVGYSWGGLASVHLAEAFLSDDRVAPSRAVVHRLIALDPFQPFASLVVPEGVERFWEFRHSLAPPGDCSQGEFLGPYVGIQPHCHASSECLDYDYSTSPGTWFPLLWGGSALGEHIGHCTVPKAAFFAARDILTGVEPTPPLPTPTPVPLP